MMKPRALTSSTVKSTLVVTSTFPDSIPALSAMTPTLSKSNSKIVVIATTAFLQSKIWPPFVYAKRISMAMAMRPKAFWVRSRLCVTCFL